MFRVPISRRSLLQSAAMGAAGLLSSRLFAQVPVDYAAASQAAQGSKWAVATAHPLATQAAARQFRNGGNAIDAAVAASLMLSVVDAHNSGIGGGGLALMRLADGRLLAIDGRETAPMRSLAEHYLDENGKPVVSRSQIGALAVGVPGLLSLLQELSQEFGRLSWQDALLQAALVAEQGYAISDYFAKVLQRTAFEMSRFPASAAIWLDPSGKPRQAGDMVRQTDMAQSLRNIAQEGTHWFYQGEFAEKMERYMIEQGGWLRADDLANYKTIRREPIVGTYRGHQICGFPPPSSGGIHIGQMLGMLEPFDVAELFQQSTATGLHLLVEVMKRAMADRVHWLGDDDFAKVPRGLLDLGYLSQRSADIDLTRSVRVTGHGIPPRADIDLFGRGGHTTHLTTADADGNVVALTQTVNTSFGSKMVLPGTGITLNNQMDDFSLAPGVRNAFGLLGSQANQILAGKRPLSSMSPTLVLNSDGTLRLTVGAAGGPRIITTVLQAIVRMLDLGMAPVDALGAPRVHHQWSPDLVMVEDRMPGSIVEQLQQFGHTVNITDTLAVAQAIEFKNGQFSSASDPRVPSSAAAL